MQMTPRVNMMRKSILIFIFLLMASGCRVGTTVGVGTGGGSGTSVGVSTGAGRTSVGVGLGRGAVVYSSYDDFLYSGTGAAYSNNRKGMKLFLDKKYSEARAVFQATLEQTPGEPDAQYYHGMCLIFLEQREAGLNQIAAYRDPFNPRISSEVKWWANYCRNKPNMTAEQTYRTLNKARAEGYKRQQDEERERLRW